VLERDASSSVRTRDKTRRRRSLTQMAAAFLKVVAGVTVRLCEAPLFPED